MRDEDVLDRRLRKLHNRRDRTSLIRNLILTAVVVYLLFGVIFGIAIIKGDSMHPSFREGDIVLFFRLGKYKQGDVILIDTKSETDYIKRIIGMPFDEIDIDDETGMVIINGRPLQEPYAHGETHAKAGVTFPLVLGEDEYFCLGDNRLNSLDSRNYGPVKRSQIDGKVIFLLRRGS